MTYNPDNYVTFVFLRTNPYYSFAGYTNADGDYCYISDKNDPRTGEPVPRRFTFRKDKRFIKIPINQKDREGRSVVEHLRNSPECAGSPNAAYDEHGKQISEIWFKELNDARDAGIIVESKLERKKATDIAMSLEGDDLRYMATMCGCFNANPTLQTLRVIEYAEAEPSAFMKLYQSPDRLVKAMLRTGVAEGKIKKVGTMLQWEGVTLGGNEDDAASKLSADEALYESVKTAVYGASAKKAPVTETVEKTEDKRKAALAKARAAKKSK